MPRDRHCRCAAAQLTRVPATSFSEPSMLRSGAVSIGLDAA
jgi:hypothetical protein